MFSKIRSLEVVVKYKFTLKFTIHLTRPDLRFLRQVQGNCLLSPD